MLHQRNGRANSHKRPKLHVSKPDAVLIYFYEQILSLTQFSRLTLPDRPVFSPKFPNPGPTSQKDAVKIVESSWKLQKKLWNSFETWAIFSRRWVLQCQKLTRLIRNNWSVPRFPGKEGLSFNFQGGYVAQNITDEGMKHITQNCHNLERLALSGCSSIRDITLKELSQNCPDLKTLEVASCVHLSDSGFIPLAKVRNWKWNVVAVIVSVQPTLYARGGEPIYYLMGRIRPLSYGAHTVHIMGIVEYLWHAAESNQL